MDPMTLAFLPYKAAAQAAPPLELLQFAGGFSPQFTGQVTPPPAQSKLGGMEALLKMLMTMGQPPEPLGRPPEPHFPQNPYIGATGSRQTLQPMVAMPQTRNPNLQSLMQYLATGGR